jgi:AAHS family 4-hydroxybenzoate transporter-like MFS transporter
MGTPTINVARLIDQQGITRFQGMIFGLCALVVFLDGIDTQVIGLAAPVLSRQFGFERQLLGWVFSAGTLGATIGAFACGLVADRFGRKTVLVLATAWFGLATLATSAAGSFEALVVCRFLTGLGLGGAIPCFVALTTEYSPARQRATIISLMWSAFPLGGMVGGFINAYLIATWSWQSLFVVWGAVPVLVAGLLAFFLPESIRFLLSRQRSAADIGTIVRRIVPSAVPADAAYSSDETHLAGLPLRHLFTERRTDKTLLLWAASFLVFGSIVIIPAWAPALLAPLRFAPATAAIIVAFNGLGSFVGTAIAGRLVQRFGVVRSIIPSALFAALGVGLFGLSAGSLATATAASLIAGLFLGIASSSIVTLSALAYPTAVRSTGIGWSMGWGRCGSVAAPLFVTSMLGAHLAIPEIWSALGAVLVIAAPCIWWLARRLRLDGIGLPASRTVADAASAREMPVSVE